MSVRSKLDKFAAYFYIPVNDNEEVQQAQYDVLDALDANVVTLEPQEPDRLHISLLFIERIKDDDLEDFFNRLNPILPVAFQLEVVRTGTFRESDEKPLVLHVAPHPALLRLQQELHDTAKSMGFPISVHSEPKYYSPHISLAYNYHPQDIKLPDLKAPFKIPVYSFVAARNDYQTVRTIFLPNFYNEQVMVTRPVFEEPTSAGTDSRRELDRRIEQMAAGDEPEAKLPKKVRIVYNPELKYEARQSRSREFVDIELGPAFWDIGDSATRAGALAFQFGNILADEMIKGPGGPHEWSRADAMLLAPPKEQEKGFRYVFGQNSLIWAASMVYASYVVNGPGEMEGRGYHDARRWIELAMEEYPDYDAENSPDFHSLIAELGDAPPRGVYPEYLIGKGGPGSGHHGHKGRPGEVGGSLPSGMAKLPEKVVIVGGVDPMSVNDFHFKLNEFDEWMETHPDIYTDPEMLRDRMNTVIQRNLQRAIIDFTEDTGHVPRNVTFTDDPQVILDEYYNFSEMNEAQAAQVRKEVYWRLYNGAKASFIGLEDYPDNKKIIHLNMDVQPNEYNLALEFQGKPEGKIDPTTQEFYESVQHELGHWLALEARVRNLYENPDDPYENSFAPSDEWKSDNRFYDPSEWAHEYQADLIASLAIGDMGFRSRNRALTEAERADRDRLMAKIDERMAAREVVKTRSAPRPVIALIPWGDGTYEGILTTEDDLPEEERGKGVVVVVYRGGPGSGHRGHKGRPGEVGGSLPSGAAGTSTEELPPFRERQPNQEMRGRRSKYGVRENHDDILGMSPKQVQESIAAEMERAQTNGLTVVHEMDKAIDLMWTDAVIGEVTSEDMTREKFIENWTKIYEDAGGEPDPRFVLATIRDLNDAVEAGWLKVPEDVYFVIRRNNKDFDGGAQANFSASVSNRPDTKAKINIFQTSSQSDAVTDSLGEFSWGTLEDWLEKDREFRPLIPPEGSYDPNATFVGEYFGKGMGAIVLHELGHYYDRNFSDTAAALFPDRVAGRSGRAQVALDWNAKFSEDFADRESEVWNNWWEASKRAKEMVSFYGSEYPNELVAEAYALSQHPDYETLPDERKKYIEQILYGKET